MKEIKDIIIEQIETYNEELEDKVDTSKGEDTILFGAEGVLDSITFVNLIVDIEHAVQDEYGKKILIVSAKAMSQKNSPFKTIGSLAEYIKQLLGE